jgi:hypothetical protein
MGGATRAIQNSRLQIQGAAESKGRKGEHRGISDRRGVGSLSATSFPAGCQPATIRRLLPEASAPAGPGTFCLASVRRRRPRSRPAIHPGQSARSSGPATPACLFVPAMCPEEQSARRSPASRCLRPRPGAGAGRCPSTFRGGSGPGRRWRSRFREWSGPVAAQTRLQRPAGQSAGL